MVRIASFITAILFSGLTLAAQNLDQAYKHIFSYELGTYNFREFKNLQPGVKSMEMARYDGMKENGTIVNKRHFHTTIYEYDEQGRIIRESRMDEFEKPVVKHIYNEKGQYVRYEVMEEGKLTASRDFSYNENGKLISCFQRRPEYGTHKEVVFIWDGDFLARVENYDVDDQLTQFRNYHTSIEGDRIVIKFDEYYVEEIKYEEYDGLGSETWICDLDGRLLERIYDPIDEMAMKGQTVIRYDPVTKERSLEGKVDPEAGLSPNIALDVIPPFTHIYQYTYSDLDERGNWQRKIKVSDPEVEIAVYERKFTYR